MIEAFSEHGKELRLKIELLEQEANHTDKSCSLQNEELRGENKALKSKIRVYENVLILAVKELEQKLHPREKAAFERIKTLEDALEPFTKDNLCEEVGMKYRRWFWLKDRTKAIEAIRSRIEWKKC